MNAREARDDGGAVERLKFLEAGAVHDPGDDAADVEGPLGVQWDEPSQLVGRVEGLFVWALGVGRKEGPKGWETARDNSRSLASPSLAASTRLTSRLAIGREGSGPRLRHIQAGYDGSEGGSECKGVWKRR